MTNHLASCHITLPDPTHWWSGMVRRVCSVGYSGWRGEEAATTYR